MVNLVKFWQFLQFIHCCNQHPFTILKKSPKVSLRRIFPRHRCPKKKVIELNVPEAMPDYRVLMAQSEKRLHLSTPKHILLSISQISSFKTLRRSLFKEEMSYVGCTHKYLVCWSCSTHKIKILNKHIH